MRYLFQEPLITTVTDEEVTDLADIFELVKSIKDNQHDISLVFEDPDTHFIRSCDNARIITLDDKANTISVHAFYDGASAKFTGVPLAMIRKIRLVANRQQLSQKYKVTRWHNMEIAEIES